MLQEFKSLVELTEYFKTERDCQNYFAFIRWGDSPKCPHCSSNRVYTLASGNFKCTACDSTYTVKLGTIFENSKISLKKWFIAIFLISTTKKGISSIQLSKEIGTTQKTAWYIMHRIREVLSQDENKLDGIVEVDETYIGGKEQNKRLSKRLKAGRGVVGKEAVLGMIQRGGTVKAFHISDTKADTLEKHIAENVSEQSTIFTDEHKGYSRLTYIHDVVKHSRKEYVRGNVHTNTIEGFWATVKRSVIGIYHIISTKHLNRYLREFTFRYNFRKQKPHNIMNTVLSRSIGKRLRYSTLVGEDNE